MVDVALLERNTISSIVKEWRPLPLFLYLCRKAVVDTRNSIHAVLADKLADLGHWMSHTIVDGLSRVRTMVCTVGILDECIYDTTYLSTNSLWWWYPLREELLRLEWYARLCNEELGFFRIGIVCSGELVVWADLDGYWNIGRCLVNFHSSTMSKYHVFVVPDGSLKSVSTTKKQYFVICEARHGFF